MTSIFISHATKDDDAVNRIAAALKAAGIETWVDHQHGINAGDVWSREIQDAVNNCNYGLFVLSPISVKSDYCEAEWNRILALKKKLYVAQIQLVPLADYPLRLGIIQYSDLTADFDTGMAELIRAIKGGADLDPQAPTTVKRRISGRIDPRLTAIPMSGRDEDLQQVIEHLRTQPVAILGVGGLGKSRLAAEVARTDAQVQGAIWHVASDISRADEMIELLRDHFDLAVATDPHDVLKELRETPTLVVIDNAESVESGDRRKAYVDLITELVDIGARVLITGRAEWEELPLVFPCKPEQLELEAAKQVVLDMARVWTQNDLSAQAEALAKAACQHPRLIEWAVRKTAKFPPDKVISELKELKSAKVQEALDEMIRKTVTQMVAAEGTESEAALKRLNVFRGGFTYEAAQAILGLQKDEDTLDARLTELQAWQFVTLRSSRYEVDPLVIEAVQEDADAYLLHLRYYLALTLFHSRQQDFYGLDIESANLDAAFERTIHHDAEASLNLFVFCADFLNNRGRFAQRMDWIERIVKAFDGNFPNKSVRSIALNSLAQTYQDYPFGDHRVNALHAIEIYQEVLNHFTPRDNRRYYAATHQNLGDAYLKLAALEDSLGNIHRAIKAYEKSLFYCPAQVNPIDYSITQNSLGNAYHSLAEFEQPSSNLRRAVKAYQRALVYRRPETTPLFYATTQNNLGGVYSDLADIEDREGNLRRAIAAFEEALQYRTPEAAPFAYATTLQNLGATYHALAELEDNEGNLRRAIEAFEEALKYLTPQSDPLAYARAQWNLRLVYQDLGDLSAAIASAREAEKYYRQIGYVDAADEILHWLADLEEQNNSTA